MHIWCKIQLHNKSNCSTVNPHIYLNKAGLMCNSSQVKESFFKVFSLNSNELSSLPISRSLVLTFFWLTSSISSRCLTFGSSSCIFCVAFSNCSLIGADLDAFCFS